MGSSFFVYSTFNWKHYGYTNHRRHDMNLPTIHTNIWDAIIAIPVIILRFVKNRRPRLPETAGDCGMRSTLAGLAQT
jgi:hypothetical protein